jgi:GTP-binding protein
MRPASTDPSWASAAAARSEPDSSAVTNQPKRIEFLIANIINPSKLDRHTDFDRETAADCTLKLSSLERRLRFWKHLAPATFIKSAARAADFPVDSGREVAFVGRSNSGKSTALNLLAGVRKLARVSKTPGRTQLVNFFALGADCRLVDLPGYGFARVSPDVQERWERLLAAYLLERRSLVGLVLTVDIRRGLTRLDRTLLEWLRPRGLPLIVLLTKADKLGRGAGLAQLREVGKELDPGAHATRFSAIDREGVEQAQKWLGDWLGAPLETGD